MQNDEWSPTKSRRAKVVRSTEMFGPYAEAWLEQRELKPRTRALYRRLLDRFILPAFGEVSLRHITPQVVRTWHSGLDSSRPTQRAHTYSLLRSILSTAVTDEILASNPCRVRGAGSAKRVRSIEPATLGELEVLLESIPAPYRSLVLIGAWCGLRFGEVSELRRKDVDLKAKTIHVKRGVVRVGKEVTVGKPKNIAGVRDIAVPPHLLPILEQHLKEHVALGREALLFPSVKDPDVQVHTNTLRRHWLKARLAAGRPDLRVHDLRHTGAVLAAQSGATLAELMARIGHSTPQMALRYQHVARGRDAEIAARMSKEAKKWSKRQARTFGSAHGGTPREASEGP
jgi:integrase